jgi:hypothetical protein
VNLQTRNPDSKGLTAVKRTLWSVPGDRLRRRQDEAVSLRGEQEVKDRDERKRLAKQELTLMQTSFLRISIPQETS